MRFFLVAVLFCLSSPAFGEPIQIEQEWVKPDIANSEWDFYIRFTEPHDFFTVDEFDRQGTSFQFAVFRDSEPKRTRDADILLTGTLATEDGVLVNRQCFGGCVPEDFLALLPFDLPTDREVLFSAPFDLIGDDDTEFGYIVIVTEFGGTTDRRVNYTPEPSTWVLLILGLFGCFAWRLLRRKHAA